MIKRLKYVWSYGIINYKRNSELVSFFGNLFKVGNIIPGGVAECLHIKCTCVLIGSIYKILRIRAVYKAYIYTKPL